jgi:hypothetical protein
LIRDFKTYISDHVKNVLGWRTNRKIVVFAVDDFGNVRLASRQARQELNRAGLKSYSRFDEFDSLETTQDLEALFDVLTSVKDSRDRYVVFTPFALPCNIDFERIAAEGYQEYQYELLPDTYAKLAALDDHAYGNAWNLWRQGIDAGIFVPQFHGREHLNVKVFNEKLRVKDAELMTLLKHRSFTGVRHSGYKTISAVAAFDFWEFKENEAFRTIIQDGLRAFKVVFGYSARNFNPPTAKIHPCNYPILAESGIEFLDISAIQKQHQGEGVYKTSINYTGKNSEYGQSFMVRNVVFEPTSSKYTDAVAKALGQIDKAFFWGKPALISSHRINFSGYIDEQNRATGLSALKTLLKKILAKWPDVEFMSSSELGMIIREE